MSKDSAARFWERVNKDEAFLRKLSEAGADRQGMLKSEGFKFTVDELAELLSRRAKHGISPLPRKDAASSQPDTSGGASGESGLGP